MKTPTPNIPCIIFTGLMLAFAHFCAAQTVETTSATKFSGTISDFGPRTISIKSEISPEPFRYSYTKTTTYVDENGTPVSVETVKTGVPVTVYYDRVGEEFVAKKVVVRKTASTGPDDSGNLVSTVSAGTITELGPETIMIKPEAATEPLRYRYTKTTTYVDENGAPVSIETVKSGLPVTVYYDKQGDEMVAKKVIVRKIVASDSDSPHGD